MPSPRPHRLPLIGCLAVVLVAALSGNARAGLLGISGNYELYDINVANGVATNPRPVIDKLTMIAMSPSGTLYGVTQGFPSDVPPGGMLYTIDVGTGFPTLVDTLDTPVIVEGDIAFDPTTNELYAVESTGPLFRINTTTAACTAVGNIAPNKDFSAMAFDAAGNLWAVDSFGPTLYKVNKTNAAILATVPLDPVNQEVGGLAFAPGSGTLYYAGGTASKLYTLDTNTGGALTIGPVAATYGIWGLTFEPEPTPVESTTWGRIKSLFP